MHVPLAQYDDDLTTKRLKLLANGYTPLPNYNKACLRKGWSRMVVDEAEIRSWKGSRALRTQATGLRIQDGLCVIDVDVSDPALAAAFREEIARTAPAVAADGLERLGSPVKFALFCQREADDAFYRRQSRHQCKPEDQGKPSKDRETHIVEIFGGGLPRFQHDVFGRQFGAFGPHSFDERGNVKYEYRWPGRSPLDVPRERLPVLTKVQSNTLCGAFEHIARAAGFVKVGLTKCGETAPSFAYDLTPEMLFVNSGGAYRLDQLDDERVYANHRLGTDFRVSSSFLGHGSNPSKCIVGWSKVLNCVCVHDFETACTHYPADRKPIEDAIIMEIMREIMARAEEVRS